MRKPLVLAVDKDGIIRTTSQPNPTAAETARNIELFQKLVTKLTKQHKPVLLLVDSKNSTVTSPTERAKGLKLLEQIHYDKMAFFGAKLHVRVVGQFVIKAIRKTNSIRFFETEAEAEAWLKS